MGSFRNKNRNSNELRLESALFNLHLNQDSDLMCNIFKIKKEENSDSYQQIIEWNMTPGSKYIFDDRDFNNLSNFILEFIEYCDSITDSLPDDQEGEDDNTQDDQEQEMHDQEAPDQEAPEDDNTYDQEAPDQETESGSNYDERLEFLNLLDDENWICKISFNAKESEFPSLFFSKDGGDEWFDMFYINDIYVLEDLSVWLRENI